MESVSLQSDEQVGNDQPMSLYSGAMYIAHPGVTYISLSLTESSRIGLSTAYFIYFTFLRGPNYIERKQIECCLHLGIDIRG